MAVVLAIDAGTTGTRCFAFDLSGGPVGLAYRELTQHYPEPGWVEHDAAEIWDVTRRVAVEAIVDAGIQGAELEAVGITNQRETVVAWDPRTGEPLHRAIVWQDRRTAQRCDQLRDGGHLDLVRRRTGLVLDPSGTRKVLLELAVRAPSRASFAVEDDAGGARRSLVNSEDHGESFQPSGE